jgi:pimeloyl-ACP methyl ester carboxylesterase
MPFLSTTHGTLFVAQSGQGPPLVCVHGAGGSHEYWGYQRRDLAAIGRVIALDLPGHGRSPGEGAAQVATYSAALLAALDALELEQAILLGHSMGGAVALWTALHAPARVRGLALLSTGARLPVMPALFAYLEQGQFTAAVEAIVQRSFGHAAPPQARAAARQTFLRTPPAVLSADLHACAAYTVRERLGDIACPTLVVCGDEDAVTPLKFSHTLHQQIAGAALVVVPGAGHMALLEQPEVVNAALRNFVGPIAG